MRALMLLILLMFGLSPLPALAAEKEYCEKIADEFVDFFRSPLRDDLPLSRTDTVSMFIQYRVHMEGAHSFHYRDTEREERFHLLGDGRTNGLGILTKRHLPGEVCVTADEEAWQALRPFGPNEIRTPFSFHGHFIFSDASGTHSYDQLKDGLRDARWRLVDLTPVPAFVANRFLPKNKYVQVVPLTENGFDWPISAEHQPLTVEAWRDGERLSGLKVTLIGGTSWIKLSHLKKIGADQISVTGAPYRLQAQPSPRALRRSVSRHLKKLSPGQQALVETEFLEPFQKNIDLLEPSGSAQEEEVLDKILDIEEAIRDEN